MSDLDPGPSGNLRAYRWGPPSASLSLWLYTLPFQVHNTHKTYLHFQLDQSPLRANPLLLKDESRIEQRAACQRPWLHQNSYFSSTTASAHGYYHRSGRWPPSPEGPDLPGDSHAGTLLTARYSTPLTANLLHLKGLPHLQLSPMGSYPWHCPRWFQMEGPAENELLPPLLPLCATRIQWWIWPAWQRAIYSIETATLPPLPLWWFQRLQQLPSSC